jgi:hypothetical protein
MSTFAKYMLGEILKKIFIILLVFSFMAFTLNECSGLVTSTSSFEPCLKKSVKSFNGEAYVRRLVQTNYPDGAVKTDGGNWTFMVYLDGDNNLEEDCINIFLDLSSIGSTDNVSIVVQLDRIPGYDNRFDDWKDCKRFYVTKGMTPTPENAVQNLTEVNMGDPDTLINFTKWAVGSYPADKYCLVLSDHGSGCVRSVCFDDTSGKDALSLPELSHALSAVPAKMDLLYFDACLMGMVEVAYQIRDYADVMVASEEVAWTGTPYDQYLSNLTANPSMSAGELADVIVSSYIEFTNATSLTSTMSGVDLSQMLNLATAVNNFAQRLNDSESTYNNEIRKARSQAERYMGPYIGMYTWYIDLYHFAQLIYQYIDDPTIRTDANQVMASVSGAVIAEGHYQHPNSHGLSIFFPWNLQDADYGKFKNAYSTTDFAEDTVWDSFVNYHVNVTPLKPDFAVLDVYWSPTSPNPGDAVTFYVDATNEGTQDASAHVHFSRDAYTIGGTFDFPVCSPQKIWTTPPWTALPGKYNITWIIDPEGIIEEWNETNNQMSKWLIVGYSLTVQTPYSGITVKIDGNWYATKPDGSYQTYVGSGFHSVEVPALVPLASWTQGLFVQWNDGNSSNVRSIFVDNDLTMTAEYVTQYYLTVKKNPSYVGATITGQGWYNNGTMAIANCTSPVHSPGTTYRYVFVNWTGDAFGDSTTLYILMNSPKTVTANYKEQYNVTFTTYGCGGSPHVIVDGVTYSLPCSFWLDSGSSHTFSYESPVSGGTGVQYVLTSTSRNSPFTVTYGATITGNYKTQFYITVNSAHGTPTPSQWIDEWSHLSVNVQSPTETIPNQTQWLCTGFSVDHGALQVETTYTFWTIQEPHEIEFYWLQQFWLQVNTGVSGSTVTGTGWYDNDTAASILANTPYTVSAVHRFVFVSWVSTGTNIASITNASSPQTTVHMDNYYIVQANWKEQFYLTVKTNPMGLTQPIASPGGPWYNNGTSVTCTAQKTSGYGFDHWTVDGASQGSGVNPIMVTMDAAHEFIAHYVVDNVEPSIGVPIHQPDPPNQGEKVTVLVNVTDSGSRVGEVFLYYRTNSSEAWNKVNMSKLTGDTYVGEILGFEADTHVQYYVIAYDNAYNQATQDKDGVYYGYIVIPEFQEFAFLLLFMSLSLIAVMLTKKIRRKVTMNAKS